MRILFIGCSWTDHRTDEHGGQGPYIEFAKSFSGRVDVVAHGGTSIDMHYDLLQQLNIDVYDFIFFQITAAYRGYWRKKKFKKLTSNDFVSADNKIYDVRTYLENNYEWYTPSSSTDIDTFSRKKVKKIKKLLKSDLKDFEGDRKWLNGVYEIKDYLENSNVPFLMYHHVLDHLHTDSVIQEAKKIDSVEAWLGDLFQGFCVDNGNHFDTRGNKVVANTLYSLYKDITS